MLLRSRAGQDLRDIEHGVHAFRRTGANHFIDGTPYLFPVSGKIETEVQ
ncbi:hypothetical protein J2Z18_002637 [Paenibacillus lactis]|uniref:Uncharacterized protein n=1 Tax=Paenibacillus lactis TaxID=228574 RepID=A0ABS4FB98_9BACL|nr:hypothetical protein [Paenibacillus lactis]